MPGSPGGEDNRIFFPPPKAGGDRWARLHKPFGMLLLINLLALGFSAFLAWNLYRHEQAKVVSQFESEVDQRVASLTREISLRIEALYTVKTLFEASAQVTSAEFEKVTRATRARHSHLRNLGWIPRVSNADRPVYEQEGAGRQPGFQFTEWSPNGSLVRTEERQTYLPLYFLEPLTHQSLLGLDLASLPMADAILQASRDGNRPLATRPAILFPNIPDDKEVLIFLPVFLPDSLPGRQLSPAELQGFIFGILDLNALLNAEIEASGPRDIDMRLIDLSAPPAGQVIHEHRLPTGRIRAEKDAYRTARITVAGREYSVSAWPTPGYLAQKRTLAPLLTLLTGCLFTLFLSSYLRLVSKRSSDIERQVEERTRKLHEVNQILADLSMTDGLTGIANRRNFDSHLAVEWKRALREQQSLTLILVDIDHFKAFNDYYGHLAGDHCLCRTARILQQQISRPSDLAARYGGEEFALILPSTDRAARALGEQCRKAIEALEIPHQSSPTSSWVTASVGIASMIPQHNGQPSELVAKADRALYDAKQNGRNRIALQD